MLEVSGLHTYYGESHVLQGVSLTVGPGEVVAILGRNGMGKTTLMRSIIGFTPPRRGAVRFKGQDITGWAAYRVAALGMALVPQGRVLAEGDGPAIRRNPQVNEIYLGSAAPR